MYITESGTEFHQPELAEVMHMVALMSFGIDGR